MTTVQTLTGLQEMDDRTIFGKAVWLSLHKIKREATPHTKPTQVASHFILPNRTQDRQNPTFV